MNFEESENFQTTETRSGVTLAFRRSKLRLEFCERTITYRVNKLASVANERSFEIVFQYFPRHLFSLPDIAFSSRTFSQIISRRQRSQLISFVFAVCFAPPHPPLSPLLFDESSCIYPSMYTASSNRNDCFHSKSFIDFRKRCVVENSILVAPFKYLTWKNQRYFFCAKSRLGKRAIDFSEGVKPICTPSDPLTNGSINFSREQKALNVRPSLLGTNIFNVN